MIAPPETIWDTSLAKMILTVGTIPALVSSKLSPLTLSSKKLPMQLPQSWNKVVHLFPAQLTPLLTIDQICSSCGLGIGHPSVHLCNNKKKYLKEILWVIYISYIIYCVCSPKQQLFTHVAQAARQVQLMDCMLDTPGYRHEKGTH